MAQMKRPAGRARARHQRTTADDRPDAAMEDAAIGSSETLHQAHRREEAHLGALPSGIAPQIGAAAAVAVATAFIEAEMLPAVLIGAGTALLPRLLPEAGQTLRPMLKTAVRAGYSALNKAQQWAAEASEQQRPRHARHRLGGHRALALQGS